MGAHKIHEKNYIPFFPSVLEKIDHNQPKPSYDRSRGPGVLDASDREGRGGWRRGEVVRVRKEEKGVWVKFCVFLF